ncbi:hypothetical protein SCHPADRAFT_728168 [Schizopora paradoxa]|uniref:N-acetyltransferase domain-containing protein n=1 Tax=Schizopora paradoxa TaxID=27342 RepID=A0A0H2R268_9AGAM|nr:hypothetical protein SCHPADRAFT_728168 [Schizopora paradoxa]
MENLAEKEPSMTSWWMEYFLPAYGEFTTKALGSAEYKLKAWHLQLIGVFPAFQRRGVGTALIKHTEEIIKHSPDLSDESKRMCLETESEGGLAFYKSCGFVDKGLMQVKSDEKMNKTAPMWCVAKELS